MNYDITDRFELLIFEDAQQMIDRIRKEEESRKKKLAKIERLGYCEGAYCEGAYREGVCNNKDDLDWYSARTFYSWNKDKNPLEDPNRDLFLCPLCAKEYNEYWDEMWKEYYEGTY